MVEGTGAWSFCLQECMFLKTERACIGRLDWLFLSVLYYTRTEAKIMFDG